MSATVPDAAQLHRWSAGRRDELIEQLAAWARIPSIAGVPERRIDMARSAQWLAGTLRDTGFPIVETWPTEAGPAVFAEWPAASGAPTVLVYSHHDVRTVKPEQWQQCPPFEPALRGGRLYGRGTSDAKGQILAHLFGLRAYLSAGHDAPPITLKLLVEAEEETGSPHLADVLRRHADRIRADLVVLSDTMTWAADRPAICTGIRGMMKAHLEIRGPSVDVHAGSVAGAAANPVTELARVLATLHATDGTVAIPGFYDDVAEASDRERAELARLTADEQDWLGRTSAGVVDGERDRTLGELLYTRPSAEVLMLAGGDPEPPTTGTMPASATADIQLSLVPHQDPARLSDLLHRWAAARIADRYDHTLTVADTINQRAYLTPPDHPALEVLGEAMSQAWGCEVGRMRNAGGAPAGLLADAIGAPIVLFGTGLPEDRWHGPDESVDLDVLIKGAVTLAQFWPRLAHRVRAGR